MALFLAGRWQLDQVRELMIDAAAEAGGGSWLTLLD
jgi:hypothetical protein